MSVNQTFFFFWLWRREKSGGGGGRDYLCLDVPAIKMHAGCWPCYNTTGENSCLSLKWHADGCLYLFTSIQLYVCMYLLSLRHRFSLCNVFVISYICLYLYTEVDKKYSPNDESVAASVQNIVFCSLELWLCVLWQSGHMWSAPFADKLDLFWSEANQLVHHCIGCRVVDAKRHVEIVKIKLG